MSAGMFLGLAACLLVFGMPVSFSMAISSIIFLITNDINPSIVLSRLLGGIDMTALLCVPFFMLAGEFMNVGGIGKRLVFLARMLVGSLPGGLCFVAILACTFFASLTGVAVAVCAALGAILIPEMKKAGYTPEFATAVVSAGSTLGPIIPPSIAMIVYATLTGTSVASLFMVGVPLGLLISLAFCIFTFFYAKAKKFPIASIAKWKTLAPEEKKERRKLLFGSIWSVGTPVIILGGIFGGIFTPTEGAVIAALYSLIVGCVVYRELPFKEIPKLCLEACRGSVRIMWIISCAGLFAWCLSYVRVPQMLMEVVVGFTSSKNVLILLIMIVTFALGMVIDAGSIQLITIPFLLPLMRQYGFDLVHAGAWITAMYCLGTITPPFGTVLFVGSHVGEVSVQALAGKLWPFIVIMFGVIAIIAFFPGLVMWVL